MSSICVQGTSAILDVQDATFAWEEADFNPTLPCEHRSHEIIHVSEEPAWALIEIVVDECGEKTRYLICKSGWDRLISATKLRCDCSYRIHTKDHYKITVIEVINPTAGEGLAE